MSWCEVTFFFFYIATAVRFRWRRSGGVPCQAGEEGWGRRGGRHTQAWGWQYRSDKKWGKCIAFTPYPIYVAITADATFFPLSLWFPCAAVDGDGALETSTRAWTSHHQDLVHYYHETDPGQGPDLDQTGQCLRPTENSHWTGGPALGHPGPALGMSNTWGQRRQGAGVCLGAGPGARAGSGLGPGSLGSECQSGSGAIYGLQIGPDPGQHSYLPPPHGVRPDQKHQRSPAFNTFFHPNTLHTTTTTSVVSRTNHNTGPMAPSSLPLHPERAEGRGKTDRERPYSCPTCGKRFAEAGYVKKHQTVHTKEKPFRCKQCWKSFSFLSNLIRHRGVHSAQDQAGDLTGVHGGANASIWTCVS